MPRTPKSADVRALEARNRVEVDDQLRSYFAQLEGRSYFAAIATRVGSAAKCGCGAQASERREVATAVGIVARCASCQKPWPAVFSPGQHGAQDRRGGGMLALAHVGLAIRHLQLNGTRAERAGLALLIARAKCPSLAVAGLADVASSIRVGGRTWSEFTVGEALDRARARLLCAISGREHRAPTDAARSAESSVDDRELRARIHEARAARSGECAALLLDDLRAARPRWNPDRPSPVRAHVRAADAEALGASWLRRRTKSKRPPAADVEAKARELLGRHMRMWRPDGKPATRSKVLVDARARERVMRGLDRYFDAPDPPAPPAWWVDAQARLTRTLDDEPRPRMTSSDFARQENAELREGS